MSIVVSIRSNIFSRRGTFGPVTVGLWCGLIYMPAGPVWCSARSSITRALHPFFRFTMSSGPLDTRADQRLRLPAEETCRVLLERRVAHVVKVQVKCRRAWCPVVSVRPSSAARQRHGARCTAGSRRGFIPCPGRIVHALPLSEVEEVVILRWGRCMRKARSGMNIFVPRLASARKETPLLSARETPHYAWLGEGVGSALTDIRGARIAAFGSSARSDVSKSGGVTVLMLLRSDSMSATTVLVIVRLMHLLNYHPWGKKKHLKSSLIYHFCKIKAHMHVRVETTWASKRWIKAEYLFVVATRRRPFWAATLSMAPRSPMSVTPVLGAEAAVVPSDRPNEKVHLAADAVDSHGRSGPHLTSIS